MIEEWRDIPGWEGVYQASSLGQIRSLDRVLPSGKWGHVRRKGHVMKYKISQKGYRVIGLRLNGKRKWYGVHRLVCMAFHGLPPEGKPYATHWPDRDPLNCRADNLRWESSQQNTWDMREHGTTMYGEKNHYAKVTLDQVKWIKKNYHRGRPCHPGNQEAIARMFDICPAHVQNIANGKAWAVASQ